MPVAMVQATPVGVDGRWALVGSPAVALVDVTFVAGASTGSRAA